jgi:manganese-dependent inorganic pyrophosphatase
MLCRAAITVQHMLDEEFVTFRDDEPLRTAERSAVGKPFAAFPVVNDKDEVVGILSKSDFLKKVDRKLILVDHNELSQAVQGADEVDIIEIIDHHRIGALNTQQPIYFLNDPVGSTSTIVADCFLRHGVELSKPIAGLLLAGLVSDTLNLTSPTTTPRDGAVLKKLEVISGVNAAAFTEKLFSSGSILITKSAPQAITADCKEYVERGRKFSVAQIEEIGFDNFWKCKADVLAALESYCGRNNYFLSTLLVTDVVEQDSLLLVAGDPGFLELIDYPEVEPGIYELDDVVSRKKQLLPYLTHCLQRVK